MYRTIALMCLTAALAWAQDPVKVAGGQYRLIAENEDVRLLEVNLAPGAKTVMHSHPDCMAVMLQPGVTKWTMPDGKTVQSTPDTKRGTVIAMDAQTHISENMGKTTLKAVLIEFKKAAPTAARKASSAPSCKVVAESPHATAQLCGGAAGSMVAKHTHSAGVVYVALTDVTAEITDAAGKMHTMEMKKDAAAIAPPETHSAKNTGKAAYQLIVVDLK
jgi:quercetin dioxygenase-like cupin family protein